jgi:hypothetical protein
LGGLHEKHAVATWNIGNHLNICFLKTQETQGKPVSRWPVALTSSQQPGEQKKKKEKEEESSQALP